MQRTVQQEYATFLTPAGQSIMGAVLRGETTLAFDKCQVGSGLWDVSVNESEAETTYTVDVPEQLLSPIADGLFDIDTLTENSTGVTQATVNVPADFGPATINEAAWLLDDGTVYAITRYAALPVIPPQSGTSSEVSLRAFLNVGDVESVTLVVDSAINASREYVDESLKAFEAKLPKDASAELKGIVQLSNQIDSDNEFKAATPKAVKAVYDLLPLNKPKVLDSLPIFPEIINNDKKLLISLSVGKLTIAENQVIRFRGWRDINTDNLSNLSFTLDLAKTYHLRFDIDNELSLNDIESSDYNPDSLSESDRSFDTTYDNVLLAKISNGVVTTLINQSEPFSLTYDGLPNSADATPTGNDYVGSFELPLNWSRSPISDSVEIKGHLAANGTHSWNDLMVMTVLAMREDAIQSSIVFDKTYTLNRYECRLPVAHANGARDGSVQPTPRLQMFEKIVRVYGY
ncbi:tail fiber protein [Gammaproteobacteria bacterium AS21]